MKELYIRHVAALLVATSVVSAAPMEDLSVIKELADAGYVISNTPPEYKVGARIATLLFTIYRNNVYYKTNYKMSQRVEYHKKMNEIASHILEFCLGLSQARTTMLLQTNNFSYKPEHDKGFMAKSLNQDNYCPETAVFITTYKKSLRNETLNCFQNAENPVDLSLRELYDIFLKVLPKDQQENINELFDQFSRVLELYQE